MKTIFNTEAEGANFINGLCQAATVRLGIDFSFGYMLTPKPTFRIKKGDAIWIVKEYSAPIGNGVGELFTRFLFEILLPGFAMSHTLDEAMAKRRLLSGEQSAKQLNDEIHQMD
jgi:hypothetical protein